jgi:hypothetical protein
MFGAVTICRESNAIALPDVGTGPPAPAPPVDLPCRSDPLDATIRGVSRSRVEATLVSTGSSSVSEGP